MINDIPQPNSWTLESGCGACVQEFGSLILETLLSARGLRTPAQFQLPISQMGKPRHRMEKQFMLGHPWSSGLGASSYWLSTIWEDSECLGAVVGVTSGVLQPFLPCFPPPSDIPWLTSDPFFPPPQPLLQIRLPRFPKGLGDRVWLPECPDLGTGWKETRIHVSFPHPQPCPLAAVWVDPDTPEFAKWTETPKVSPKANQKGPPWKE